MNAQISSLHALLDVLKQGLLLTFKPILTKLKQHKMLALGEHQDIDLDKSREILEVAL